MLSLVGEERSVRLFRDSDVQAEDLWAVQVGLVVEIAVVLGDDGRERKSARAFEVALRVVDEEGVAPRDLRRPCLFGPDVRIDASEL